MPSLTRIICLANSWKRGERCIAGINPISGKWIRPVSDLPDGQVPKEIRQLGGLEPALLDILAIPLAKTGPDFDFESENLSIIPGKWQRVGEVPPDYLLKFSSNEEYILHDDKRYVTVSYMRSLPVPERRTLQLVKTVAFSAKPIGKRFEASAKWEGSLITDNGKRLTTTITDPVFVRRLELGYQPKDRNLVTVSLGMPWRPPDWEGDDPCWKLIAGVVELPSQPSNTIETETDDDDIPF